MNGSEATEYMNAMKLEIPLFEESEYLDNG
jgi:hypothetical protein